MEHSESKSPSREHLLDISESANHETNEGSSLETNSAESESAASYVTQIDVTTIVTSSEPRVLVKNTHHEDSDETLPRESSGGSGLTAHLSDAKKVVVGSVADQQQDDISSSNRPSTSSFTLHSQSREESKQTTGIVSGTDGDGFYSRSSRSTYEISDQTLVREVEEDRDQREKAEAGEESYEEEEDEEDTTVSSEAVVDDIELILMPEMVQDLPNSDLSPQLVRVTELKRSMGAAGGDYETEGFQYEEEYSDQESDFKKMESEDDVGIGGGSLGVSHGLVNKTRHLSSQVEDNYDEDDDDLSSSVAEVFHGIGGIPTEKVNRGKVNSGVQTDITALESTAPLPYEFRHRQQSLGKSSTTRHLGVPTKKLNWKSELTLLPSKTKITGSGFTPFDSMNDQGDQYSPRVAKFTSQDTLNTSSQFMKPSTLYRTRNLSRNLNECDASESTLVMPMRALPKESPRFRERMSVSTSTSNFRESTAAAAHSYSAYQMTSSMTSSRRQPTGLTSSTSRNFRSSLPDLSSKLSSYSDNKGRRQASKCMKYHKSVSGQKLHKKSSSDDETSSLIDESERCLRSSIDLLLTDDLPSPGADFSCRSAGFGSGSVHGYYSSRRSHSQPVLFDDEDSGDYRDSSMGSPFLPRKLSDMRCSRWAKVILPNGQVAVVAVKEMDELKDLLSVHTDSGCILTLPFRKVVFAWKRKR